MALKKKYLKEAKNNFKKAWKLQKAAAKKGKKKTTKKKVVKKKSPKKVAKKTSKKVSKKSITKKGSNMAKKKKSKSKSVRRPRGMFGAATQRLLIDGVIIGGTTLGASVIISKIKFLENWKPWQKGLALGGASVLVFMLMKNKIGKTVALGLAVAGATTAMLPILQKGGMAGGRKLSNAELALITGTNPNVMGKAVNYETMGKPVKYNKTGPVSRRAVMGRSRRY